MNRFTHIAAGALLGLALPFLQAAQAETLYSPPVTFGQGEQLVCHIRNVSQLAATVTIYAYVDQSPKRTWVTRTLLPGEVQGNTQACASGGTCYAPRCDFVTNQKKSAFRASACVSGLPDGGVVCLPAQ